MHGNVWEWAHDWYDSDYYHDSPKKNPLGPLGGSNRILRGGSWFNDAVNLRSAFRFSYDGPGYRNVQCGVSPSEDCPIVDFPKKKNSFSYANF